MVTMTEDGYVFSKRRNGTSSPMLSDIPTEYDPLQDTLNHLDLVLKAERRLRNVKRKQHFDSRWSTNPHYPKDWSFKLQPTLPPPKKRRLFEHEWPLPRSQERRPPSSLPSRRIFFDEHERPPPKPVRKSPSTKGKFKIKLPRKLITSPLKTLHKKTFTSPSPTKKSTKKLSKKSKTSPKKPPTRKNVAVKKVKKAAVAEKKVGKNAAEGKRAPRKAAEKQSVAKKADKKQKKGKKKIVPVKKNGYTKWEPKWGGYTRLKNRKTGSVTYKVRMDEKDFGTFKTEQKAARAYDEILWEILYAGKKINKARFNLPELLPEVEQKPKKTTYFEKYKKLIKEHKLDRKRLNNSIPYPRSSDI